MSLDLFIESKNPVLHRGTGIYIRENGETRELATKQEVLTHFPDAKEEDIKEHTYKDNEYFHLNLTHNLTEMADKCTEEDGFVSLYDLMWHPGDTLGIKTPSMDYVQELTVCYTKLLKDPEYFKKFNPDNGWGTYEQLLKGTRNYLNALLSISTEFENYTILADT